MNSLIEICGRGIRVQGRLVRMAKLEGEIYVSLNDPEPLLARIQDCGIRIDIFTFVQGLSDREPKYAYPMEWDNLAALQVSTFEDWWNNQLGFKARNKAKQAGKKGVVIREVPFDDALVRGIWEIYNECPVRQGRRYSHYGKDHQTVYKEEATFLDKSIFVGAFFGRQMIGFAKLVYSDTRAQANLMNIVSMMQHRDKAPTNALIAQAVRSCAERRIPYLVYSKFVYGRKEFSSLIDFKERNGFKRVDLPRYYVPLTPLGRAALRLGLQHRFADRLPQALVAKARDLRRAWYNRKLDSVTEAS